MKDISMMVEDVKLNVRSGLMIRKGDKVVIEISPIYDSAIFPGGRIKTLESSKSTLLREIKEEMHVELKDEEIQLAALIENFYNFDNTRHHEIYFVYKLDVEEKDTRFDNLTINYDSDANYYKIVDREELKDINLLPSFLKELVYKENFEHRIIDDLEKEEQCHKKSE